MQSTLTTRRASRVMFGVLGAIVLPGGRVPELAAVHRPAAGDRQASRNDDRRKAA